MPEFIPEKKILIQATTPWITIRNLNESVSISTESTSSVR
jgi:hypothetical protein